MRAVRRAIAQGIAGAAVLRRLPLPIWEREGALRRLVWRHRDALYRYERWFPLDSAEYLACEDGIAQLRAVGRAALADSGRCYAALIDSEIAAARQRSLLA